MYSIQDKVNRLAAIGIEWMGAEQQYFISGSYQELPDIDPMTDEEFETFCINIIPQLPTVIDKSMDVLKQGGVILQDHEITARKAEAVGKKIIAAWTEVYNNLDSIAPEDRWQALADLDARSNKFLVTCATRLKERKEGRAIITQLMDRIKTLYTSEENKLDPKTGEVPKKVQEFRNRYFKERIDEDKRLVLEAEKKKKKAQEAIDLQAFIRKTLGQALVNFQADKKIKWNASFNAITLADYEEKAAALGNVKTVFPETAEKPKICHMHLPAFYHHTQQEADKMLADEIATYDFQTFFLGYGRDMADLKKSLIDRLPSKLAELQEAKRLADKAEEDRLELKRQNDLKEKQRQADLLQAQNDLQAQKELKEKQDMEREEERLEQERVNKANQEAQDKLDQEKLDREKEEQAQLDQERLKAEQQVSSNVERGKVAGYAGTLFNKAQEITPSSSLPAGKQGFEIKVTEITGWVEIFSFWWERIGVDADNEDFAKKTLGSMKKDIEAIAVKAAKAGKTDQIVSKYLIYEETAKAMNKRVKDEANG